MGIGQKDAKGRLQLYAKAFETIKRMTEYLLSEPVLHLALQEVTNAALALVPAEHVSIRVLDESGEGLLSNARSGRGLTNTPVILKRGYGVIGWVVETGKVANIGDTSRDERYVVAKNQGFPIMSILAVPLVSNNKVIGVLGATSGKKNAFNSDDELILQLLANCAVSPIDKARLRHLAITDSNTGAYNMGYLYPRLNKEMERSKRHGYPLSLLFLDLDHFKLVNDRFGHAAGDQVLREIADRIRRYIRADDVLVRRGGEEFVVIMPYADLRQAMAAAERIRKNIEEQPIVLPNNKQVHQTVSIGVVTWDRMESPQSLDARADAAMYRAKGLGRNRVAADMSTEKG